MPTTHFAYCQFAYCQFAYRQFAYRSLFALTILTLTACTGLPDGIEPVSNFDKDRYLGRWYEIARLDHRFERNMARVTADYSLRDDGSIRVINRGYNTVKEEWDEAEGTAKFVGSDTVGHLKVSFFGPFYGSYVIVDLAADYSVAMVTGPDRDYLWFLARTPTLPQAEIERLTTQARALGLSTNELIFVDQVQ